MGTFCFLSTWATPNSSILRTPLGNKKSSSVILRNPSSYILRPVRLILQLIRAGPFNSLTYILKTKFSSFSIQFFLEFKLIPIWASTTFSISLLPNLWRKGVKEEWRCLWLGMESGSDEMTSKIFKEKLGNYPPNSFLSSGEESNITGGDWRGFMGRSGGRLLTLPRVLRRRWKASSPFEWRWINRIVTRACIILLFVEILTDSFPIHSSSATNLKLISFRNPTQELSKPTHLKRKYKRKRYHYTR